MSAALTPGARAEGACVVTTLGALTAGAIGREALWRLLETGERPQDLSLSSFKAAARFVDRKFLRATSAFDAFALSALGILLEARRGATTCYDEERIGLYVGASPTSADGNAPYVEAMLASRGAQASSSVRDFGRTCMTARPITLLVGLPNNVLCYGSMMLNARGPNSNYTAPWLSGILAVLNAWRRLRRGSLDLTVAGAYSTYATDLGRAIYRQLAARNGLPDFTGSLADGAAFVSLERRSSLQQTPSGGFTSLIGGGVASDGQGPLRHDSRGAAFERLIRRVIAEAGLAPGDIGLILAGQGGLGDLDTLEQSVLARVFPEAAPAAASLQPVLGNLMEARGVVELGLVADFFAARDIPPAVQLQGWPRRIDDGRRAALIVQASPWGEYGCLVAHFESSCNGSPKAYQ
jgi:3-oxoacyl-(acyl-carrier-protein) synthase